MGGRAVRQQESLATQSFLTRMSSSPAGMVVEGAAGIGKTTLVWQTAETAGAQGIRVLSTCGSPTEVRYAFGAVADLLRTVDADVYADLPAVQQTSLERVIALEGDGPPMNERIVAAAFLSVVQHPSFAGPVLLLIDDAQWLDASSQAVLSYTARRLNGPVGILASVRTGDAGPADPLSWLRFARPDSTARIRLRPMTFDDIHTLVSQRLGHTLPRPIVTRIHEISDGNPFFALELARSVAAKPSHDVVDLPDSLATLVRQRIGRPGREVAAVMLAAACAVPPTVERLSSAVDLTADRVVEIIDSVESSGIVELKGNAVHFCHPLFARGIYTGASPSQRRDMHRKLAAVVEEPELKARHLALASTTGDPSTLQALDEAAEVTAAKGAPAVAAELLELAIKLGGDTPIRRLRAAEQHFRSGTLHQARSHVQSTIDDLPARGFLRWSALMLLAGGSAHDEGMASAIAYLNEAIEVADQPALTLHARLLLVPAMNQAGQMSACVEHARIAVAEAERLGIDSLRSQALAIWVLVSFMHGLGLDERSLNTALALEDPDIQAAVTLRASAVAALTTAWAGQLDRAREQMARVQRRALQSGTEIDILWATTEAARINMWMGRYSEATELIDDALQRAEQIGGRHVMVGLWGCQAMIAAHSGDELKAATAARESLHNAQATATFYLVRPPITALAFLAVSRSEYSEAVTVVQPLLEAFDPSHDTEIVMGGWLPDAIEALTALGRTDEAESLVAALEHNGAQHDRPWMLAIGARGRSHLLAALGELEAAEHAAQQAMAHHRRLPMPFENARTQLLLGQLRRRRRRKQAAEPDLREALHTFERLGAPLWADRARAELVRLAGPTDAEIGLTTAERQIAERAAAGQSNKQIAAELFVAPKTVERHLSNVYRKLGIRSRAGLSAALRPASP